ncbi:MAG TPA: hypothetical protein VHZ07_25490 [Bryobacteraceae bacterium]|jgi:hypothetical protein|nr:hypothetical protein [Bryobacteraceae bacterium]
MSAQTPLTSEGQHRLDRILANSGKPERLACDVSEAPPFLDFTFRFATGYFIACPVRIFGGEADTVFVYVRVTPEHGEAVTLGDSFRIPAMPDDLRPRVNVHHVSTEIDFRGGFGIGEGHYTVELILCDRSNRVLRKHWRITAIRSRAEHSTELTVKPNTVGPLFISRWNGRLRGPRQGLRLSVLLDATPIVQYARRLYPQDRILLLDSLYSLLKEAACSSVQLIAFNLDQQQEVFRDSHFGRVGWYALEERLRELELGKVSYKVVSHPDGWSDLLAQMVNEQINSPEPADAVVFLGPATRIHRKPTLPLTPRQPGAPEFFDVAYYPPEEEGDEAPDALAYVTRALDGQIFKIHSPAELSQAIQKIYAQLAASRRGVGMSPADSR